MWKIDNYGNAINDTTQDEIYIVACTDGLSRVYRSNKCVAVFKKNSDAVNYIKQVVKEESENEEI